MMKLERRVAQIVADLLGVDAAQVIPGASFIDDLGADSLAAVELIMAFEEEFQLEIPDQDAEGIVAVEDAIRYLRSHGVS